MTRIRFAGLAVALVTATAFFPVPSTGQNAAPRSDPNTVVDPALFAGLRYRNVGPSRGGRVTAVTGVPGRSGTFYMGATGGGVWRTTDYGQSWHNISDSFFATGSIGAIRTAPSNSDIVYTGTGSDGIRSNVIIGKGVYKSTDAGKSWRHVGLATVGQIGAVEIHPGNPDVVFVAAMGNPFKPTPDRGVYRSRDGGATWEKVLFVSDSTGAVDLELSPDNPNDIYAAMWRGERKPWTIISGAREGGIYKSTDGGSTWSKLGGGLPTDLVGKSDLAVSPADPNRLYVLMEAAPGGGLYRSDDRGVTFQLVSTENGLIRRPFYYTNVDADPTNADIVYVSNEGFFRSSDGGRTWQRRSTPHGDNHDLWIDPADPRVMIQSNDGGANVTRDGGETWSTQENQPTAELYQVAVDDRFPYWLYAGQQDNTTIAVPSLPPFDAPAGAVALWRDVGGCETGPAIPKPGDPDIVYSNCKGQFGRFNQRTGQEKRYWVGAQSLYSHNPKDLTYRFQRVVPIHVSPHDPNTVYHGSQFLHRTRDEGVTWETISPDLTANEPDKQVISGAPITRDITGEEYYSTIYVIRESPRERGVIWVGSNDGPVHVTRDNGKTWQKVTPPDLPSGGRVQNIDPSPHRPGKAYIAVYRYLLGDFQPYLYRTTDYGRSWTRLTTGTNGIPDDHPTRVVREDPDREGLLYAGTEFGIFVSFDDGAHWQPFQLNLPVTPVTDIVVHRKDLAISTMGRSFWILDNVTPLHQIGRDKSRPYALGRNESGRDESRPYLLSPRDAYRFRYSARGGGGGGAGAGGPTYPPPGAQIDYYMAPGATGEVSLEILDGAGGVVRRFTGSTEQERLRVAEPGMRSPLGPMLPTPRISGRPGMHRFVWDLSTNGPINDRGEPAGRGPMVPPGQYSVRITLGEWNATAPLRVQADPRVTADGVAERDLAEQYRLALRVRDLLDSARRATIRVRELRERENLDPATKQAVDQAHEALVTAPGPYPTPKLLDQIAYLYSMLIGADQKPGRDAHERLAELDRELTALVGRLKEAPGWGATEP